MDEILYELRDHRVNLGRWDYIFSFIKKFRAHPEFVLRIGRWSQWKRIGSAFSSVRMSNC